MRCLVQFKASLEEKIATGNTVCLLASATGVTDVMEALIACRADVNWLGATGVAHDWLGATGALRNWEPLASAAGLGWEPLAAAGLGWETRDTWLGATCECCGTWLGDTGTLLTVDRRHECGCSLSELNVRLHGAFLIVVLSPSCPLG